MVTGSFRCDQLDWRRTYGDHEDGRALATATLTTVQRAPIGHSRGWARLTIDHTNDRPGGTVTGICYDRVVRLNWRRRMVFSKAWNFSRFSDAPNSCLTWSRTMARICGNSIFLGN
ncbi:hypothetical protein F9C07_283 [Aspergillus flavus]|uniref:Uncharacterized protein n=2 Tax=Aspergillus flavus TaxID=5059 RepID=A0A7U2QWB0_ASPFN|nr:hypothetical protein AFLA70_18g005311 [Aspergillus flavus AF70]QRD87296.1 hypothetical protein F9C07_283 [Aspergillus flavus]RAQ55446.1 hypothetical protein AFGD_007536 [Aspergillus flavus]RAQ66001.1 hypothetical protein COH21_009005 [Aspergillus flavus]RAQ74167.1 hypothetical protein COH20_008838 [Aspergillus flavus]